MKRIFYAVLMAIMSIGVSFQSFCQDTGDFPIFYLRGSFTDPVWQNLDYVFNREGNVYSIHIDYLDGQFKISNESWTINYGAETSDRAQIYQPVITRGIYDGVNYRANALEDVTISFIYDPNSRTMAWISFTINGVAPSEQEDPIEPDPAPSHDYISDTLPVLYINVYNQDGELDNEIISKDLAHKNYFTGEYWLDLNGCEWMEAEGAKSIGSREEPLPLEIKARGNYTRKGFSKKPYKLKLGSKQSLLGLSKSKHFAILTHADDNFGYMRNFTGFNLGQRMGLPWTPSQQPVEVVINGDYRGLYFLTESIRVEGDRINIEELDDNVSDPSLASGGYVVELDNYDEDNQIRMPEKGQAPGSKDILRITFDTPEAYSDLQRQFITEQFTTINDAIGDNSDTMWRYLDLDDAARYYLVEEIISHYEAYHGSTYLFRNRGEGQKWHFSPLWDCGHAFDGRTNRFFTDTAPYGNTWIASLRMNNKFMEKVCDTWKWFMSQKFDGLYDELDLYSSRLEAAALSDYNRWHDQPYPVDGQPVVDNRDMAQRLSAVKSHLQAKIEWLKGVFGDYTQDSFSEPARDETLAAPLPDYVKPRDEYPILYLRGEFNGWRCDTPFAKEGDTYTLHLEQLDGKFKISDDSWNVNYGASDNVNIEGSIKTIALQNGGDFVANNLEDVVITLVYNPVNSFSTNIIFTVNGEEAPDPIEPEPAPVRQYVSGTLPVLYINVYDGNGEYDNEIISKDLAHKNYFTGEYWLDLNGCEWLEAEGATSIGSREEPLPLEIKARGNWTRRGFSKKPFKLKLGKKQSLLGLSKSKHFAILAHADDNYGYMRNFTGFNLGQRIGLPWTPSQQPVEVVMNGDYRGLYFLTESIRVEADRINIQELDDNSTDPTLASGGYLIELDNYEEENQIRMQEKGQAPGYKDELRITFDTPELYSDLQRRFITEQFTAINDAIGDNSDDMWSYLDLDDAARYYIVEEIISHTESYHGSTYMFRDRGEGQKWHFSPLWDCGNAFNGPTNNYFTSASPFGNTWIASLRLNDKFMDKVCETWKWFMSQKYEGIFDDLDVYCGHLQSAAEADYNRWNDQPTPDGGQSVVDNRDLAQKLAAVKSHLQQKTDWLKERFGNFDDGEYTEPERDVTDAAPLPEYLIDIASNIISAMEEGEDFDIYDLQGMKVDIPREGNIYIIRSKGESRKVIIR